MADLATIVPNLKRKTRTEWCAPCPFCGGKDRFIVTPSKDLWWCRQCNESGDSIEYLRKVNGMTFQDAKATIEGGVIAPQRDDIADKPYESAAWQGTVIAVLARAQSTMDGSPPAYEWLARRGIDERTAIAYHLGVIPRDLEYHGVKFYKGLAIPHIDRARITAVKIRTGSGKYLNVKGGASNRMFGLNRCLLPLPTIIVESELDALTIKSCYPDWLNAVATGGTQGGKEDVEALLKVVEGDTRMLICAFDADDPGDAGYKAFWQPQGARRLRPMGAKDPGEMYALDGRQAVIDWIAEVL